MRSLIVQRTRVVCFVLSVVAVACGISPFAPTDAIAPPSVPARWTLGTSGAIKPQANANLCVVVSGGTLTNGPSLVLATCTGSAAQQWVPSSDGEYRLGTSTGYCFDTYNAGTTDGTRVFLWNCYGSPSQFWTRTAANETKNFGAKCVQYVGTKLKAGVTLEISTCTGAAKQKWTTPTFPADTVTPPPPADTNTYINVLPGQSIQAAVDANPAGAKFKLKAGTFTNQSVVPKAGDLFRCEAGAILNGGASTVSAFGPGSTKPANVVIKQCEITSYGPTSGDYAGTGAITAGGHTTGEGTRGWLVDSNYIHDNRGMGVRIGHMMTVRGNRIIHNAGPLGLGGIGDSTQILNNEIATSNYTGAFAPGFEAGGFKFVLSYALVARGNWVHNNTGFGLWGDIANRNMVFDGNTSEDNTHAGIFYEIGYGCTVKNNIVRRNGLGDATNWLYPAGILIGHSSDCEVYGNTVENNVHGIVGIQQNRTDDTLYGPHILQNLWVHDNTIVGSATGFAAAVGRDFGSPFTANNRFTNNTYTVPAGNTWPFAWADGARTWGEWQGFGQDVAGSFNP